jgi:hypothetical protein
MNADHNILIEGSRKTPTIDFNHRAGEIILTGVSLPENAARIYEPLLDWINEYIKSPQPVTNFRLNLEYYNSSTTLWLAKMLKALSKIRGDGYLLFIHMYMNIEDFDELEADEVKDLMGSLMNIVDDPTVSIGIKVYGTDERRKVLKESTILI